MTALKWDQIGERLFETGVDHGVLYLPNGSGIYANGYAWNGLVSVTESPSGAESNPQFADNIKYLNLVSAEDFGATLEAFSFPKQFDVCDGYASPAAGISFGQQGRSSFGLHYRTKIGNDVTQNLGYKLHLLYGLLAAPSEKNYQTVNDSPEALTFSWELSATPVDAGPGFDPTASVTIDSTEVDADALAALEDILYGTVGVDPRLPMPAEVAALFAGTVTTVTTVAPTYNSTTDVVTIPSVTGVVYYIDGEAVTGTVTITETTVVTALPAAGYVFSETSDDDWTIVFA